MSKTLLPALRKLALRHSDVEEGVACQGTALEKWTVKVGKKAFLFLGTNDLLLKLGDSLPEARKLAKTEPGRYRVGKGGWVKVLFTPERAPATALLGRWIDESYRLIAGSAARKPARSDKAANHKTRTAARRARRGARRQAS